MKQGVSLRCGTFLVLCALGLVAGVNGMDESGGEGVKSRFGLQRNGAGQSAVFYHFLSSVEMKVVPVDFPEVDGDQDEALLEFAAELAAVLHAHEPSYSADLRRTSTRAIGQKVNQGKTQLLLAGAKAMELNDRTTLEVVMGLVAHHAAQLPAEMRQEIKDVARSGFNDVHQVKYLREIKALNELSRDHLDRTANDHRYNHYADIHVNRIQQLVQRLNLKHVWRYGGRS